MKIWRMILLAVATACVACSTFAASGSRRFGPLQCDLCPLQEPLPDEGTMRVLNEYIATHGFGKALSASERIAPGDIVVVCNRNACVSYTRTDDNKWDGTQTRPLQRHSYIETIKRMRPEFVYDFLREQRRGPGQPPPQPFPISGSKPVGRVTVGPIKRQ